MGDLAKEGGDILLNGSYRGDLNCDYLQMAHHGQRGVRMDFYRSIEFEACLWSDRSDRRQAANRERPGNPVGDRISN